jgi:isopentenyl diphosphate isomerase/L-lactate dehydrogenase-like FMN-dependent dehydrogenase
MWGWAVNGQDGVFASVNLVVEELRIAMQIIGCSSIAELRRDASHIIRKAPQSSHAPSG